MSQADVDLDKLRQKIQYIRDSVRQLEAIRSRGKTGFLADPILQAAATRFLQTGVEAMIDAAHHVIARQGLGLPQTYQQAMDLLIKERILPSEKGPVFEQMVKFRNRVVHLYQEVDPAEVYSILDSQLGDFEDFIRAIVKRYFPA